MFGSKEEPYPWLVLISFWGDYDIKNKLKTKFGNIVIQLMFYLLGMLTSPEKLVRRIFFFFRYFQQNSRWPTNHMLLSRA